LRITIIKEEEQLTLCYSASDLKSFPLFKRALSVAWAVFGYVGVESVSLNAWGDGEEKRWRYGMVLHPLVFWAADVVARLMDVKSAAFTRWCR